MDKIYKKSIKPNPAIYVPNKPSPIQSLIINTNMKPNEINLINYNLLQLALGPRDENSNSLHICKSIYNILYLLPTPKDTNPLTRFSSRHSSIP